MTTYAYQCSTCGEIEIDHPFSDPAWGECPICGDEIRRLITCAPRFVLKGHGWNLDGYSKDGIHDTGVES